MIDIGAQVIHDGLTWIVSARTDNGWLRLVREGQRGVYRRNVRATKVRLVQP